MRDGRRSSITAVCPAIRRSTPRPVAPQLSFPSSQLAACNYGKSIQVYYQAYNGKLRETSTTDGTTYGHAQDIPTAAVRTFTPLAACSYENGNEARPAPPPSGACC